MLRSTLLHPIASVLCLAIIAAFCSVAAHAAQTPQTTVRAPITSESSLSASVHSGSFAEARAAMKAGATPITVEHEGNDTLGAKLAVQLKEIFNIGTLFALDNNDIPKLQMIISTAPEFPSRPAVGSVYSVIWVYSERANVLSNYLAHEVGILTPEDLDGLASRLASRTAGIAARHSYIFNK